MSGQSLASSAWLAEWMKAHDIFLWGGADLSDFSTPVDETGRGFAFAISLAVPMNPQVMKGIQNGPSHDYVNELLRVNNLINELSTALAGEIMARGIRGMAMAASKRTDTVGIKGDFPHKTAATRAGLGWVGRNCQLVTHRFGPWIRLGTVFTDLELSCGPAIEENFCGSCMLCVEACPAKALKGAAWYPGILRGEILDARECDQWKKKHYFRFHKGRSCGICSAVCPYGLSLLKREYL